MDRENAMLTYGENQEPSIQIDFGGQYVPYTCDRVAMIPENWYDAWNRASMYQNVKHSVTIQDYTPMQESLNVMDASAPKTTFIQNAPLWIYTDPNRYFREWNIIPKQVGDNLYDVNNKFMRNMPTTQEEGKLKRCVIDLGRQFTNSCTDALDEDLLKNDAFNTVQGMLKIERISPGQTYHYETKYNSSKCRWYPIGVMNENPNDDIQVCNQYPAVQCPTKTGYIECNAQTYVNHNFLDEPLPLIIKIQDFHGPTGNIYIDGQIRCIYTSVIRFRSNPSLGFYQLALKDRAMQLTNVDPWKRVEAPKSRHVWCNPRLATIKGIGIAYNMTDSKLDAKQYLDNDVPNTDTRTYRNVLSSAHDNLSNDFDFYNAGDTVPNNTDAEPESTILTSDHTFGTTKRIAKRKGTSPTREQIAAKKLKTTDGTIIDQANNKDLPVKLTTKQKKLKRITEVANNLRVINQRQGTAATQVASLDPYQDESRYFT